MSKQKEIFAAIAKGEFEYQYGAKYSALVRRVKHTEAEERNANTLAERRRSRARELGYSRNSERPAAKVGVMAFTMGRSFQGFHKSMQEAGKAFASAFGKIEVVNLDSEPALVIDGYSKIFDDALQGFVDKG